MSYKDLGVLGELQDSLDLKCQTRLVLSTFSKYRDRCWAHRVPQGLSRTPREITAGRTHIRHEGGIAAEEGSTDDVGEAGRGVTRSVHHLALDSPNIKGVSLLEQSIKLGSKTKREKAISPPPTHPRRVR